MSKRYFICNADQLPREGKARAFHVEGLEPPADATALFLKTLKPNGSRVALYNTKDGLLACDDRCPHLEAPMFDGKVHKGVVTCAWHYWQFSLDDGKCVINPEVVVRTYTVEQEGDQLFIVQRNAQAPENGGEAPASP